MFSILRFSGKVFLLAIFSAKFALAQMTYLTHVEGQHFSEANGVSDDGSIIVGESRGDAFDDSIAFTYQNDTLSIFSDDSFENFSFYDISGSGEIIVGAAYNGSYFDAMSHAIKYENGVVTDIGTLGGDNAAAYAVSDVGGVITGYSSLVGDTESHAFKYQNGVMTDLGTFGGDRSAGYGVSGDGSVIVGFSQLVDENYHAFKYQDGVMTDLGTLGGDYSIAFHASYDGSIIVGGSSNPEESILAFKYQNGVMTNLGSLADGDYCFAKGISYSGKVIVGYSNLTASGDVYHAFKYTEEDGMVDLGTLGGTSSYANAVSNDGSIILGYSEIEGDTEIHAFIVRGDAVDSNSLVDINNTTRALAVNAAQLNSVLNLSESLVNYSLNQDAKLFGKNNLHFGIGTRFASADKSQETGSTLKLAYRFSDNLRAGIFLDYGFSSNLPNNFELNRQSPLVNFFTVLSENKDDLGLSLRLATSYNSSNLDISRSTLTNTEAGSGKSSLVSKAALAQLAYAFKINNDAKIQPYFGMRFSEISRESYVETSGADFPITFNGAKKKSTTALIGTNLEMALSENLNTRFGIGAEKDLSASLDGYSGDISYLGSFDLTPATIKKNRYFANIGTSYKLTANQEVSLTVNYSKQSLASSNAIADI